MAPCSSYIHKLNVVRFETLLATETDAAVRVTLSDLLAEENTLLAKALEKEAAQPAT